MADGLDRARRRRASCAGGGRRRRRRSSPGRSGSPRPPTSSRSRLITSPACSSEVVEEPELAVGQVGDARRRSRAWRRARSSVERPGRGRRSRRASAATARSCTRTRASSSSSANGFGEVVARAELEAAQLRRQVGARGEDRRRAARAGRAAARGGRSARRAAAAAGRGRPGRSAASTRAPQPGRAVGRGVDGEPLRLEAARAGTRGSAARPR